MKSLLAASLLLSLGSCASGPGEFIHRPEERIAWPAHELSPRVSVLFAYHGSNDAVRNPGFWSRLGDWVVGEDVHRIGSPYGMCLLELGSESEPDPVLVIADTGLGMIHLLSLITCEHRMISGTEEFPLVTPVGAAALPGGRFCISDSTTGRIGIFNSDGEFVQPFAQTYELGRPTGLAWDDIGQRLLVVDTIGGRILAFNVDGELSAQVGIPGEEPGEFNHPTNLAVSAEGRVFVMDSLNFRVQVLNADLTPAWDFGLVGTGPGSFAKPKGIALDSEGHVYVVDAMFGNIQVFDQRGTLLLAFCESGNSLGSLSLPAGLLIDGTDRIFVADMGNSRIQVFQYHSIQP
ncbi:MAG: hypothetical protein HQ519_01685 [Planctomycetes bacterium]|nr:hypothetical protein [Planctomycetota bacterium]